MPTTIPRPNLKGHRGSSPTQRDLDAIVVVAGILLIVVCLILVFWGGL